MDINIDKKKVYEHVSMNVSTLARNLVDASGNSRYDEVHIQERDNDLLDSFYSKALSDLTLSLRDFILERKDDLLILYLDDRSNMGLVSDIKEMIHEYLVNRIVSDWLKLKSVESSANYIQSSEELLKTLIDKLYYRNAQTDEDLMNKEKYRCTLDQSVRIDGKHVYEILLFKNMILNDVDKELFSMYKKRKEFGDTLQANTLERHGQITSYVSKYTKRLTERISAYILSYRYYTSADNNYERKSSYRYVIGMPCSWNSYNMEQLAEEMHLYVVNSCLMDYLKVNFPEEALIFKGVAESSWDSIKHLVSVRRPGTIYKPLQAF